MQAAENSQTARGSKEENSKLPVCPVRGRAKISAAKDSFTAAAALPQEIGTTVVRRGDSMQSARRLGAGTLATMPFEDVAKPSSWKASVIACRLFFCGSIQVR